MDLKSRIYTDSDYSKQRKLFELSFPETVNTSIVSDAHYKWKFKTFPAKPSAYEYVSEDTDLVGYYAAVPYQYKIGNEIVKCGMVCDVMTHPDRRGKGIFTKLGKFATDQMKIEGLSFTSGYPIRPEVIPGHLKVGWEIVVKMPMYIRLLGTKTFLPKPIRFLSALFDPIVRLLQIWTSIKNKNYSYSVYTPEDFLKLKEYSEFLESWLSEQKNALVKSVEFLKWRTGAPETQYQFLVLKRSEKIVGVSVVRSALLKGVSVLAVLDIMILSSDFFGAKTMHQAMKMLAVQNKNDAVVCMATPQWAKKYRFAKSFFIPSPAVFSLIVKKLTGFKADSDLFRPDCWHLFWIDSDDL